VQNNKIITAIFFVKCINPMFYAKQINTGLAVIEKVQQFLKFRTAQGSVAT